MNEDVLRRAIALSKKGKSFEARKILEKIVQEDPKNDIAWIWLADTYDENPDRIKVLEEWQNKNPNNLNAKNWLAAYRQKNWQPAGSMPRIPVKKTSQVVHFTGDGNIPLLVRRSDQIRKNRTRKGNKRPFLVPALAVGLLFLVGLGFLGVWIIQRQGTHFPSMSVFFPLSSPPTQISTATGLPKTIPTPLPSSTASPSSTPSPAFTDTPLLNIGTIIIDLSYLYAGPSSRHPLIQCGRGNCIYHPGDQMILVESHGSKGNVWYLVTTPDGKSGWLFEGWLLITGDPAVVPTASAYPTYPPP